MAQADLDHSMMAIALGVARRGLGRTAPNPSVGAIIVDEACGEVIARGWTQPGGRPHAETEALGRAGRRARDNTMYVTLEPCAHHGKTPPCAGAIIAAGMKRVVIGIEDPDPRVAGQGIARLRAAGIEVASGVSADAARGLTLGHILRATENRPFVQIKMALAADGTVPFGYAGRQTIVTGPESRARGHLLRAEADAILAGRKTVLDDDPELTCRLPGLLDRSPVRVVLSSLANGLAQSRLIQTAQEVPVWVFCGPEASAAATGELEAAGARVVGVPAVAGRLSLEAVTGALAREGITRLLVEGGAEVWQSFAAASLVDEVVVFHAGPLAGGAGPSAFEVSMRHAVARHLPNVPLEEVDRRRSGHDMMFQLRRPGA